MSIGLKIKKCKFVYQTAIIFSHFEKLKGRGNIYEIFFIFRGVNVYKKGINLETVNLHTK